MNTMMLNSNISSISMQNNNISNMLYSNIGMGNEFKKLNSVIAEHSAEEGYSEENEKNQSEEVNSSD